jgi:hypothetical protein
MKPPIELAAALLSCSLAAPALAAQDQSSPSPPAVPAAAEDSESLAKKLSNPVASLISVPFQANLDFGGGLTDGGN